MIFKSDEMAITIGAYGRSDVGWRRSSNEDAFILRPDLGFFAVADGMGGAAAGEVASRLFIESAESVLDDRRTDARKADLVRMVFSTANRRIWEAAVTTPKYRGMGCTADVLVVSGQDYVVGHVGDSRTYLFRKGTVRQITKDHSLVQEQLDQGLISQEQARSHTHRNVVIRSVGIGEVLAVDLVSGKAFDGDAFLLCSDGLTDMIDDAAIQNVFERPAEIADRTEQLIALAKSAGGRDNITVVLCEVKGR